LAAPEGLGAVQINVYADVFAHGSTLLPKPTAEEIDRLLALIAPA
jgi:hypothetical protein